MRQVFGRMMLGCAMARSKVAVLRVHPDHVLDDIDRLHALAGAESALARGAPTILKDNISWHFPFPAANTTPWQLEGTIRALRGATRIHLAGGSSQHVRFSMDARDLSGVNSNGDRVVAGGSYRITVGGGQPGTGASQVEADFAITGEQRLPE